MNYFDKMGQPISADEWATLWMDDAYRRVKFERLEGVDVSTVWIGVSAGEPGSAFDPPYVFETMVFGKDDMVLNQHTRRYVTLADASAGHDEVVDEVKRDSENLHTW